MHPYTVITYNVEGYLNIQDRSSKLQFDSCTNHIILQN